MDELNPRKRPRPVVSCLRCRDKKLKCDRTAPCENCIKAQLPDSCSYQRHSNASAETTPPVLEATASAVEDLQARLAKVEELLGVQPGKKTSLAASAKAPAIGTVIVKGNRSIFHGQNDRTTLLNQFLEVRDSIKEMSEDKQIQASAKQIKFLQNRSRHKAGSPASAAGSSLSMALLSLHGSLPAKPYCDRLVAIYCQNFERTFRVLHIPTFMRHYNQIWTGDNSDVWTSTSIIPELTAVMTMACHMDDAQQIGDDKNYRVYLKGAALDRVQAWLDELGRKQRTEISTLQVELLLLLSRSLRGLQPEKLWSSTGALVRSAMVMGLNVDPTSISGITPYNAETRRRIWATILEVDLQASMFCGMPLVIPELDPSSIASSNLNDADFDELSTALPPSLSQDMYTDNIYQVILASSLPHRIRAMSLIQHSTPDLQEGVSLGKKLEEYISHKPPVMDLHNSKDFPTDGGLLMHRVLLDLYLRRPALRLYKALLLGPQQDSPILIGMRKHCLESSQTILFYQDLYTISTLTMVTNSPWAHQNFFYQCCKMDVLWAALTVCDHVKQYSKLENPDSGHESAFLIRAVENTIVYLTDRIGQRDSDLKDIVFLALVLQSVQLADTASNRSQLLQQTARRILSVCREKLLQPLNTSHSTPMMQRSSVDTPLAQSSMPHIVTPPISNPRLTPSSLAESGFPMSLPVGIEQWFGDQPELAMEYNIFQAGVADPYDLTNFGIAQDWYWDHMWQ